jgi:hypothetical protein
MWGNIEFNNISRVCFKIFLIAEFVGIVYVIEVVSTLEFHNLQLVAASPPNVS